MANVKAPVRESEPRVTDSRQIKTVVEQLTLTSSMRSMSVEWTLGHLIRAGLIRLTMAGDNRSE